MSLKEEIFAMPLADLGLHESVQRELILRIRRYELLSSRDSLPPVTVGEVVETFGRYEADFKASSVQRIFLRELVERGLTRLDWLCLPRSTVTQETLAAIPCEELLAMPALIVGTAPYLLLSILYANPLVSQKEAEERYSTMVLRELLEFDAKFRKQGVALGLRCREHYYANVLATRKLLKDLNISSAWRFMNFGGLSEEIIRINTSYGLKYAQSNRFLNIARSEQWIPKFFPEV